MSSAAVAAAAAPASAGAGSSSSKAAPSSTAAFLAEVNTFKLAGVVAWHAALFLLAGSAWLACGPGGLGAALSAGSAAYLLLVYATLLPVLAAQRRLLTTLDVPPLYVGRLGWGSKAWPCLLAARCVLRNRTLASAADAALLHAGCVASALLALPLLQPAALPLGGRLLCVWGCVLGLLFGVGFLIRGKNVLSFPLLQRHRYFRLKQRMPALAKSTLWLATLGLLLAVLVSGLLQLGGAGAPWPGLAALAAAWRSSCLLVFGWAAGGAVLEVVFTEPLSLADAADDGAGAGAGAAAGASSLSPASSARPLLEGLAHPDAIVQAWALRDLVAVAEGAAGCLARRAALFDDETGASGWVPLARYCLAELHEFVGVAAGCLPALRGAAAAGAGVRWNSLQLSAAGGQAASRQQDLAAWHLQARHGRLVAALRVLSGLGASGLALDSYGLLQLSKPDLGDVLGGLLAVVAVLQAYIKATAAIHSRPASRLAQLLGSLTSGSSSGSSGSSSSGSSWRQGTPASQQHVDAAALALLDVARTATYRLTNTYGGVLASVVAVRQPVIGSQADASALLASFLAYEQ